MPFLNAFALAMQFPEDASAFGAMLRVKVVGRSLFEQCLDLACRCLVMCGATIIAKWSWRLGSYTGALLK